MKCSLLSFTFFFSLSLIRIFILFYFSLSLRVNAQVEIQNPSPSGPTKNFSLKKAVEFAINQSPDFNSSQRQLNISQLEEESAKARIFPSLDLTAKHGIQDEYLLSSNTNPYISEFKIGLTESLYDNGAFFTNREIASLTKKKSELSLTEKKAKLALDVVIQYINYSLQLKLLEIQERQLRLVNKEFEQVSKDYHQGIKTKKDFLRFKSYPIRREIDVNDVKIKIELVKQELQKSMGLKTEIDDSIQFAPLDLEVINDKMIHKSFKIEDHLLYQISLLEKKINHLSVDLVKRKKLPELFFNIGASYASSNYLGSGQNFRDNDQLGWSALFTVQYNFLDWGIRSRDHEIAKQKEIIKANELDTKMIELQFNINQTQINLEKLKRNYELAKEWVSLEFNNIEYIGREYRNGKVQYLDLISGLNDLSDAQNKFYSLCAELQKAQYNGLYYQGNLDEFLAKQ